MNLSRRLEMGPIALLMLCWGCQSECDYDAYWGVPVDELPLEAEPVFTSHLTRLEDLAYIIPSSAVRGSVLKPHSYIDGVVGGVSELPLYAPTQMTLVMFASYEQGGRHETKLEFNIGCTRRLYLDHIDEPVERIRDILRPTDGSRGVPLEMPLVFGAEKLIGYTTDPVSGRVGFDFGILDRNARAQFVNQARYEGRDHQWLLHGVCPFQYFEPELRAEYEALYGTPGGPMAGTHRGDPSRDVAGRLSGTWWLEGEPDEAHDERVIVVDGPGDWVELGGVGSTLGNFEVEGLSPEEEREACYFLDRGDEMSFVYFWVDDQDPNRLHVAHGEGACPTARPASVRSYVR